MSLELNAYSKAFLAFLTSVQSIQKS